MPFTRKQLELICFGLYLVATLVGLIVTSLVSDGLSISGGVAWIAATVIVSTIESVTPRVAHGASEWSNVHGSGVDRPERHRERRRRRHHSSRLLCEWDHSSN